MRRPFGLLACLAFAVQVGCAAKGPAGTAAVLEATDTIVGTIKGREAPSAAARSRRETSPPARHAAPLAPDRASDRAAAAGDAAVSGSSAAQELEGPTGTMGQTADTPDSAVRVAGSRSARSEPSRGISLSKRPPSAAAGRSSTALAFVSASALVLLVAIAFVLARRFL